MQLHRAVERKYLATTVLCMAEPLIERTGLTRLRDAGPNDISDQKSTMHHNKTGPEPTYVHGYSVLRGEKHPCRPAASCAPCARETAAVVESRCPQTRYLLQYLPYAV